MKDVRAPILAWGAYLVVLGASVAATLLAPGLMGHIFSLLCAAILASLILVFFMGLRAADNLLRVFALAGLMWLTIMVSLTMMDYVSRDIGECPNAQADDVAINTQGCPLDSERPSDKS
jgi:caa(3)-type oxidase subunit IV